SFYYILFFFFFFSSRRRHTRCYRDWSSDVCSSDLHEVTLSPSGNFFIDSYSQPDVAPVTVLRNKDGKLILTLEKADISQLKAARSEERRVGKECRSRRSRKQIKKKRKNIKELNIVQ